MHAERTELLTEQVAIERGRSSLPRGREPGCGLDTHAAAPVDDPTPELDRRDVPLAYGPQAHDEPDVAGRDPVLIGIRNDRRVEQGRGLD